METITLVGRDLRQACRLACERVRGARTAAVASPDSYSGPSISERHFVGILAELAVAEYFGLQISTATSTDPGYDFLIEFNGGHGGLDSKGFTHDNPRLLVAEGSVNADYYIHCRVNLDDCEVNCEEQSFHVCPNQIDRERVSTTDLSKTDDSPASMERVSVDLLGWATSEMVLNAEVKRHDSSPSHTLPISGLLPLPSPDLVDSFNTSPGYW